MNDTTTPDALLFTAPGCPHCPGVKAALQKLHEEGVIGALEVHSVPESPELAAEYGVRSVPWLRLGEFILTGAQSPQQLRDWAQRAADPAGMTAYISHLLESGELGEAEALLARTPQALQNLLPLVIDTDTPIQVRLGTGALIEGAAGSEALRQLVPALGELTAHTDHRVRADACHYLGLSGSEEARPFLTLRLDDVHPEVREIAGDALEMLGEMPEE